MKILFALLFLVLVGCAPTQVLPRDFSSSVTVTTVNGYVESIDVYLPRDLNDRNKTTSPQLSVSVSEEKELDQLIESLKTTIAELEDAKGRMLVAEEPTK